MCLLGPAFTTGRYILLLGYILVNINLCSSENTTQCMGDKIISYYLLFYGFIFFYKHILWNESANKKLFLNNVKNKNNHKSTP